MIPSNKELADKFGLTELEVAGPDRRCPECGLRKFASEFYVSAGYCKPCHIKITTNARRARVRTVRGFTL